MLKKLANNQTVMVLAAAVAVAAIYYYSQGFSGSLSGMSGQNEAAKAVDRAPQGVIRIVLVIDRFSVLLEEITLFLLNL